MVFETRSKQSLASMERGLQTKMRTFDGRQFWARYELWVRQSFKVGKIERTVMAVKTGK